LAGPGIPAECPGQNGSEIKKTSDKMKKVSIFCAKKLANIWMIKKIYLGEEHLTQFSKHAIIGNQ